MGMKHTSIRWSEPSLKLVQRVAEDLGMTTSEFIRDSAVSRAAFQLGRDDIEVNLAVVDALARRLHDELAGESQQT